MELRQLRYFLAVADERHFGRAAERLRIAQSGLSQQIKRLERNLGAQLFLRDRRQVELTEAGEYLVEEARALVASATRIAEAVPLIEQGTRGVLTVATSSAGLHPLAGALIEDHRARFTDIELLVVPGSGPQNLEALQRRTVDLAFVSFPFESVDRLSLLPIGTVELTVTLSERHRLAGRERIARAELHAEPFLTWPRAFDPPLMDHIHRAFFGDGEHPSLIELPDLNPAERLARVARSERLVGIGLPGEAELRIPGLLHRGVEEPSPRVEYGLAWMHANGSPFAAGFIDLAREAARGTPQS